MAVRAISGPKLCLLAALRAYSEARNILLQDDLTLAAVITKLATTLGHKIRIVDPIPSNKQARFDVYYQHLGKIMEDLPTPACP